MTAEPEGIGEQERRMEDLDAEGRPLTLERRLRRLEQIVGELETRELELDRALALFEEGVGHVREARAALSEAELKVQNLLGEEGHLRVEPLEESEG